MAQKDKIPIKLHKGDLPRELDFGTSVAIDTETMGLKPHRDRLCLVQLSSGNGEAHLVQFDQEDYEAPNLISLLQNIPLCTIGCCCYEEVFKRYHSGYFLYENCLKTSSNVYGSPWIKRSVQGVVK